MHERYYTGQECQPGDDDKPLTDPDDPPENCLAGQVRLPNGQCGDQGDCPLGQHKVNGVCTPTGTCPTGKIKAPDGSCVDQGCPAGQAKGKDGTCKADDDNDGEPDEDGEGGNNADGKKFSGGDSCDTPPTCSGDAIMCGQARIQWRIDCNTRKNRNITGGHCGPGGVPICTGEKCDKVEYAQLLQTWKAACALEKLANDGISVDGNGDGDADFDADAEGNAAAGRGGAGDGEPGDLFETCEGPDCPTGDLDAAGYGYATSCPTIPPISVMGTTISFDTGPLCQWLSLASYFVLTLAGLASARIIAGGM